MDRIEANNFVRLCGTPTAAPAYSHSSRGLDFFTLPLRVQRLSGAADTLNILLRREQLDGLEGARRLCVEGEVRSFNSRRGDGARLVITVLAQSLPEAGDADENLVVLRGTLCKAPNHRSTPMGREICDLMLAVNRHYGRSDYLPCICWGLTAREAGRYSVGTRLRLAGRMQSRGYIKLTDAGPVQRTAYEVSAMELEQLED